MNRNLALGLALALFGLALPLLMPFAAAQGNLFNLDGEWELEDRGVLRQDKPARVQIEQTILNCQQNGYGHWRKRRTSR